jgi:hypothetical protein
MNTSELLILTNILIGLVVLVNLLTLSTLTPILSRQKKHDILFDIAYALAWDAERIWGEGVGDIKKAQVKANLYIITSSMPMLRTYVLHDGYLDAVIREAVTKVRGYMNEHPTISIK